VNKGTDELYRAKPFVNLAGVTVRALHHYDRMGFAAAQAALASRLSALHRPRFRAFGVDRRAQVPRHASGADSPAA
jgi:hypothetical protein